MKCYFDVVEHETTMIDGDPAIIAKLSDGTSATIKIDDYDLEMNNGKMRLAFDLGKLVSFGSTKDDVKKVIKDVEKVVKNVTNFPSPGHAERDLPKGEDHHAAKLTDAIVATAREMGLTGMYSIYAIRDMLQLDVTVCTLRMAILDDFTKKTWKHLDDKHPRCSSKHLIDHRKYRSNPQLNLKLSVA